MITLLTDFGNDACVGIMKGVIFGLHPKAQIVDLAHHIAPQSVEEAAFILKSAYPYFPEGTVHCAVVDPGVGSDRSILIVRTKTAIFLAPDNGLLSVVLEDEKEVCLYKVTNTSLFLKTVSHTFHGRDIFAPVAAHLDQGMSPEKIGESVDDYNKLNLPKAVITENLIRGEILFFDHFGNAITNIPESELDTKSSYKITAGKIRLKTINKTYSDVNDLTPIAIFGSHNHLEIAVRNGNAREQLSLQKGQIIEIDISKG